MKMKTLVAALALASQSGLALPRFNPERCAHDNLGQWTEGQAVDGTARGRNAWLKSCNPTIYRVAYPGGNEFEPGSTRRAYVTYGIITGENPNHDIVFDAGPWRAPTTPPSGVDSATCAIPDKYELVGYCTSGCVTPDQVIEADHGPQPILEMQQNDVLRVLVPSLAADGALVSERMNVRSYTKDMVAAAQKIVVVTTATGKQLKLSTNHPMLTSLKVMKNADQLQPGDQLISASGQADAITHVETVDYFGKVYNLTVDTNELSRSLYIVQGYVSGDKKFQDLSVSEMNRKFIRQLAAQGSN